MEGSAWPHERVCNNACRAPAPALQKRHSQPHQKSITMAAARAIFRASPSTLTCARRRIRSRRRWVRLCCLPLAPFTALQQACVCVAICAPLSHIIGSTSHQPNRLAPTTRALQRTHWCKRRRQQCMRCLAKLGRRVSAQVVSHRARMSYYCTRSENAGGRYIAACPWAGPCDSCPWRFVKCITSILCQGPPQS